MTLDIGVFLPTLSGPGVSPADVVAAARHAERLGFGSAWTVDQLIAGTGAPILDGGTVLAAAAAATERIRLGFGLLILPLHPVAWVAKQVATLQHISGGRVVLGVGVGGDRHAASWAAAGVPRGERGARTDAALRVLPDLIAGRPVRLAGGPDKPEVRLAPGAGVPPIIVGGTSDPALRRTARYGDGWFPMPVGHDAIARGHARIAELAADHGRRTPPITMSATVAIDGDPALPGRAGVDAAVTDPDGMFGVPAEHVDAFLTRGDPSAVADRLAGLVTADTERLVVTFAAGDWFRQAELLAQVRNRIA